MKILYIITMMTIFILGFSGSLLAASASLACYFYEEGAETEPSARKWQWGLNADNSWYSFQGHWDTTPYTKVTKFFTLTSPDALIEACMNAKRYYGERGESVSLFAVTNNENYPIVSNGIHLYPVVRFSGYIVAQ